MRELDLRRSECDALRHDVPFRMTAGEMAALIVRTPVASGHIWQLACDPSKIELVSRGPAPPRALPGCNDAVVIGGGFDEAITVRARRPGPASVFLELRRPWEGRDVAPVQRMRVVMDVTAPDAAPVTRKKRRWLPFTRPV